ncbi:putative wings apart-like protein-like [Apostichopus japonicus]|uniref:Putative wings apart-like protein-like n=1 Tax=Stichopus japonicus TaxID=307972 RepID=A0A2G8JFU4_STIJA|nr:putative wings apart-like protein-like [Apostichopus japonicus]
MDLDRSSLNLLVQLLSIDSESVVSQRNSEEKEEYDKTRARLWNIVKNSAKGSSSNQLFGVTEETLSSGFFAMESLSPLRLRVAKVTEAVTAAHTDPTQIELVHIRTLNRCVRVLENVTFMNTDNQQYLLELSNLTLIKALASFLSLCEKHIEVSPADSTDPDGQDANLSKLVIQGLLANLRLLLNLTHNNEWGSMKIGEQDGLMFTVLQCVLQLPQFIPKDQRFDLLVLSLGLLINLVEHNVTNARILTLMKTNHSYDSQAEADQTKSEGSVGEVSSISALTELFLLRQRAAVKLENQTVNDVDEEEIPADAHNDIDDWITVETEPVGNNSDGSIQPTQEEIKQSIRRALHTAGRHMEDSIVASYAALLLGCLLRENKLNVKKVRDCLPNGDFAVMVFMLKKLLSFMELTDADGTTGQKSISKVIEVLECC